MKKRDGYKYVIRIFEAQWDEHYDWSVKPFFEQLKRETSDTEGHIGNRENAKWGMTLCTSTVYFRQQKG